MTRTITRLLASIVLVGAASTAFAQSANHRETTRLQSVAHAQTNEGCSTEFNVYDCALHPTSGETPREALMFEHADQAND